MRDYPGITSCVRWKNLWPTSTPTILTFTLSTDLTNLHRLRRPSGRWMTSLVQGKSATSGVATMRHGRSAKHSGWQTGLTRRRTCAFRTYTTCSTGVWKERCLNFCETRAWGLWYSVRWRSGCSAGFILLKTLRPQTHSGRHASDRISTPRWQEMRAKSSRPSLNSQANWERLPPS